MKTTTLIRLLLSMGCAALCSAPLFADEPAAVPKAFIDGTGPGWKDLGEKDFVKVNCDDDTFTWKGGEVHCTGKPVGVIRTAKPVTNFELVAQWRHLKSGGNSGIL